MKINTSFIVLFAGVLLAAGIWKFRMNSANEPFRVAFPSGQSIANYDPTHILTNFDYDLLQQIYSPIIEFSDNGEIVAGLARSFEWKGRDLHLLFRDGIYSRNNRPVTAHDALFSLKRLFILASNSHGDLEHLICGNKRIRTLSDSCPNMKVENNTLIISPERESPFLLSLLTYLDYAVIPEGSVDHTTLKIIDYSNTSGPYYIVGQTEDAIELRPNRSHYHYSKLIPQNVRLISVPTGGKHKSLSLFQSNQIDFITINDNTHPSEMFAYARSNPRAEVNQTINIKTTIVHFSRRAMSKTTPEERRNIGKKVKEAILSVHRDENWISPSNEFFAVFGEGALNEEQKSKLAELWNRHDSTIAPKGLTFQISETHERMYGNALRKVLPEFNLSTYKTIPVIDDFSKHPESEPDVSIFHMDTGFFEDVNLLNYTLNYLNFGFNKNDAKHWIDSYFSTTEKKKRIQMLRDVHFKALSTFSVIPIYVSPYVSLLRKNWKGTFSPLYATNPLWKITKN